MIPFSHYLKIGKVKVQTPNVEEARSLLDKSKLRLAYTKERQPNKKTASFVLEDAYEAMREASQSLMSLKGYKPYSHEATISFLKEYYHKELSDSDLYTMDRFRQLRHDAVYKAVEVVPQEARQALHFADKIIRIIQKVQEKIGK